MPFVFFFFFSKRSRFRSTQFQCKWEYCFLNFLITRGTRNFLTKETIDVWRYTEFVENKMRRKNYILVENIVAGTEM